MSSSKKYQRYASAWLTLFDAFKEDPDRHIEIECPDEKAAQAMRLEFYKARDAFVADDGMNREYGEVLNSREATFSGNKLIFDNKDRTWMGKAIEQAVAKE
jgi:hypothetical protein